MYKNGQAGVTKATVNITFDNSDKNQSPLGYEQYEEITITRQVCAQKIRGPSPDVDRILAHIFQCWPRDCWVKLIKIYVIYYSVSIDLN